jgi:hypothetical protein
MLVFMFVSRVRFWSMYMPVCVPERVSMFVRMHSLRRPLLVPENFAWKIFFALHVHIDLGSGNPSSRHERDIQPGAEVECRDRFLQQFRRHSRVHEGAQEHVAADAGKTV